MANIVKPVFGPDLGQIFQQGLGTFRQIKQIQQADVDRDIKDKDRFELEAAQLAQTVRGLPVEQKIGHIQDRIVRLKERGVGTEATERLLNLYQTGLQGQQDARSIGAAEAGGQTILEADAMLERRFQSGIAKGLIKAPEQAKEKFRPATQEEKQAAGVPISEPFQVSPQGKLVSLGKKGPLVQIGGDGVSSIESDRREDRKLTSKRNSKLYEKATDSANNARAQNLKIDALSRIDVTTGVTEPYKQVIAEYVTALGGDGSRITNIAAGQSFNAVKSQLVQEILSAQSGTKTDDDAKRAMDQIASLNNSEDANRFISGLAKAQNSRAIEKEEFLDDYVESKGNLNGAKIAWNKHIKRVPMLAKNMKNNGLPMFYNDFESLALEQDPGASREDIIKEWKRMDKIAGKKKIPTKDVIDKAKKIPLSINTAPRQQQQNLDPFGIGGTGQNRLNRQQSGL